MNKKLIAAGAFVLACFSACKKSSGSGGICRIPVSSFRQPNCGDTTDNFRFEAFNDSERVHIFRNTWTSNPEIPDTNYGTSLSVSARKYDRTTGDLKLFFRNNKPTSLVVYVAYSCSETFENFLPTTVVYGSGGSGFAVINDTSYHRNTIKPGCYRFYYVCGAPDTTVSPVKPFGTIKNKGHFDVEFVN